MHILALIVGGWLNLVGDLGLCMMGAVVATGSKGYVYDVPFSYPSRFAAAFELLPIPIVLSVTGLILAKWGFANL